MTKASLTAIRNILSAMPNQTELLAAVDKELNRGAEVKAAKSDMYATMKDIVFNVFKSTPVSLTVGEVYEACQSDLPAGVTRGNVQYAITRLWADELVKTEGKPNTYTVKG